MAPNSMKYLDMVCVELSDVAAFEYRRKKCIGNGLPNSNFSFCQEKEIEIHEIKNRYQKRKWAMCGPCVCAGGIQTFRICFSISMT